MTILRDNANNDKLNNFSCQNRKLMYPSSHREVVKMNKTSSLSGNPGTDTAGEALTPKSGGTDGNVLDQKIRNLNQRTNHLLARIEKDIQPAVKLQHRDAHETDLKIPEDKISERAKKAVKRAIKVNTDGPKPLTVKQIWHKLLELFDRVFGNRKTKVVYRLRDAIKRQDIGGIDELLKKEEDVRCKLCDYIRDDEKLL
ncbi:MAG: hypothetical protein LBF42_04170, partial [Puniceicoccales bacterium]|nr:hypothetical protein [Puniceicoccales bacterium]